MAKCPNCQSEDVKRSAAVHEQGESRGSTNVVGVGLGTGVGIGAARGKSRMISEAAAKNAYVPVYRDLIAHAAAVTFIVITVFGYLLFHSPGTWWRAPMVGGAAATALAVWLTRKTGRAEEAHKAAYQKQWYCLRCGAQFHAS